MAKKQTKTVQLVQSDDGQLSVADAVPDDAEEIRALLEMDGADEAKFIVWSTIATKDRAAGWVGEYTASELTMERLAQDHGKGKYRIKGMKGGEYIGQRTITIASVPKSLQAPSQTLMPAGSGPSSIQDYIALLEARDEKQADKMLKWAGILGPLLAPALANLFGGSKGPTLTDLTTALANIKQLEGGGKVDQMEEFTKLLGLVKEIQGDDKVAGSTWADIARDGIAQIGPVLGGLVQMKTGVRPALPPGKTESPPTPQGDSSEDNPMLAMLAWFKHQLEGLIFQASRNRDPLLYAEVMLDNLPAGADLAQLRGYLAREDWWQTLVVFSPGVQPYPQWFAECRAELLKGLDDIMAPPQDATAPAPAKPVKAKAPK
jgi:hypothetical protein